MNTELGVAREYGSVTWKPGAEAVGQMSSWAGGAKVHLFLSGWMWRRTGEKSRVVSIR